MAVSSSIMCILLIFTLCQFAPLWAQSEGSNCTIPPVMKGETATLTCDFKEDPKQDTTSTTPPDLLAQFRAVNASKPVDILDCYWKSGNYTCTVDPNWTFTNEISQTVSLDVKSVGTNWEGTYSCQVVGKSAQHAYCVFKLEPEVVTTASPTTKRSTDGEVITDTSTKNIGTENSPKDQSPGDGDDSSNTGTIVGVIVVVLAGGGVAILAYVKRDWIKERFSKSGSSSSEKSDVELEAADTTKPIYKGPPPTDEIKGDEGAKLLDDKTAEDQNNLSVRGEKDTPPQVATVTSPEKSLEEDVDLRAVGVGGAKPDV